MRHEPTLKKQRTPISGLLIQDLQISEESQQFYVRTDEGLTETEGRHLLLEGFEAIGLFSHQTEQSAISISEATTGLRLASAPTLEEAKAALLRKLSEIGLKRAQKELQEARNHFGWTPLYKLTAAEKKRVAEKEAEKARDRERGSHLRSEHLLVEITTARTREMLDDIVSYDEIAETPTVYTNMFDDDRARVRAAWEHQVAAIDAAQGEIAANLDPDWDEAGLILIEVGPYREPVLAIHRPSSLNGCALYGPVSRTGYTSDMSLSRSEEKRRAQFPRPRDMYQALAEDRYREYTSPQNRKKLERERRKNPSQSNDYLVTLRDRYENAIRNLTSRSSYSRAYARSWISNLEQVFPQWRTAETTELVRRSQDEAFLIELYDTDERVTSPIAGVEEIGRESRGSGTIYRVVYQDGRFPQEVCASSMMNAREKANKERAELELRGGQINDEGVYVEGVEGVVISAPGCEIVILLVEDCVDHQWVWGAEITAGKAEESVSLRPGLQFGSYRTKHLCLFNGALAYLRKHFAKRADVLSQLEAWTEACQREDESPAQLAQTVQSIENPCPPAALSVQGSLFG